MKKMQRRGKVEKDGKKGNKDGKSGSTGVKDSGKGGKSSGIAKDSSYEGTESIASHDETFGDSDEDDELVFDNLDDVGTSDETSEGGPSIQQQLQQQQQQQQQQPPIQQQAQLPPPPSQHPLPPHPGHHLASLSVPGHEALDLRGLALSPMHQNVSGGVPVPVPPVQQQHLGDGPPPQHHQSAVEALHNANPIDKLYLMQDSYFTQM